MLKVSIIIPVYNVEQYLEECLNSIKNQTYKNFEVILIDDGSTDASGAICDEYVNHDSRFQVWHNANNGPSFSRNLGLKVATGECVMFVDSDDWLAEDTLELCCQCLKQKKYDMVLFNMCDVKDEVQEKQIVFNGAEREFKGQDIQIVENILLTYRGENSGHTLSVTGSVCKMYKMEVLYNCFFPENIKSGEDACFAAQVLRNINTIMYLNQVLYFRRVHEKSLSNSSSIDYLQNRLVYINWNINFFKKKKSEDLLNFFCFYNYVGVAMKTFGNDKLSFFEAKCIMEKFLENIEWQYDFSNVQICEKNKNMQIIHTLLKKERYVLTWLVIKLAKWKGHIKK